MTPNPTMQDIADRCGVSRATVSFALRDDPRITKARREEIKRVAEELGYRPNPLVNSLMTQLRGKRSLPTGNLVALLCFHDSPALYRKDPFYKGIHDSCRQRCAELGYAFDLIPAGEVNKRPEHFNRVLKARSVTGVLIPPVPPSSRPELLDFRNLAVVKIGYTCPQVGAHRVVPFHAQAMRHTLRILKDRGYRRIGFIFHKDIDLYTNYEFVAFATRHNYEAGDLAIPFLPIDQTTQVEAVKRHILRFQPDIIVGDHGRVYEIIRKAGLRMPEDVEFCCLNTIHTQDKTAGFHQNIPLLGEEAINLLDNLIRQNRRGIPEYPVSLKVGGYWIDGPTMRPALNARTQVNAPDASVAKS
jgi:DNA-binding LacI/PurR family transcriptional regulator